MISNKINLPVLLLEYQKLTIVLSNEDRKVYSLKKNGLNYKQYLHLGRFALKILSGVDEIISQSGLIVVVDSIYLRQREKYIAEEELSLNKENDNDQHHECSDSVLVNYSTVASKPKNSKQPVKNHSVGIEYSFYFDKEFSHHVIDVIKQKYVNTTVVSSEKIIRRKAINGDVLTIDFRSHNSVISKISNKKLMHIVTINAGYTQLIHKLADEFQLPLNTSAKLYFKYGYVLLKGHLNDVVIDVPLNSVTVREVAMPDLCSVLQQYYIQFFKQIVKNLNSKRFKSDFDQIVLIGNRFSNCTSELASLFFNTACSEINCLNYNHIIDYYLLEQERSEAIAKIPMESEIVEIKETYPATGLNFKPKSFISAIKAEFHNFMNEPEPSFTS